ncbi:MAG: bacteriorhodopsin [Bacteroidota bacterium]
METVKDLSAILPGTLQQGDYVALTFFLTTIAMSAGAIFFFFQFMIAPMKQKNSILVMGMILTIAALNYIYMRDFWVSQQVSPTEFRYFDWLLTVPLICLEFYLLLRPFGVKKSKLYRMIAYALWMLVWGYIGEAVDRENSIVYGLISTIGAIGAIYEIGMGIPLVLNQPNKNLRRGYITLFAILLVGWNVYPFAYMSIPGNLMDDIWSPEALDITYNLGDIFNKIVFSIVLFLSIIFPSREYQEKVYGYKEETLLENQEEIGEPMIHA